MNYYLLFSKDGSLKNNFMDLKGEKVFSLWSIDDPLPVINHAMQKTKRILDYWR
jgi:hypothetical protein